MPIFTVTLAEPEMVPIRRLARQLDVAMWRAAAMEESRLWKMENGK